MSNIKFYAPVDFDDTSSGITIDGDLIVDTNTLFVDVSTNRVGIGTTSPYGKLNVIPSSNPTTATDANQITVGESSSNSQYNLRIGYFLSGGAYKGSIQAISGNTPNTLVLNGDGGSVGIGTYSPSSLLQVQSGVGNTQLDGHQILLSRAGNNHIFATDASGVLALGTNNAEKMRITSGGNILIGTTTDGGEKLQVSGSTSLGGDVGVDGDLDFSGGDQNKIITGSQESYTLPAQGTRMRILTLTTGTSCRVYIDSSENTYNQPIVLDIFYKSQSIGDKPQIVRVQNYQWHTHSNDIIFTSDGAASVGGDTHIYAEKVTYSTGRAVNIRKVEQFKGSVTILNGSTTDTNGGTDETVSGEFAKLKANGNIISTGNVGIGTTSPSERLSVAPDTDVSAEIGRVHVGSVGHNDYAGFSHVDVNATTSYALLQDSAGQTYLNSKTGYPINFRIDNSDKMRLFSNGNFAIGTTTDSGYKLDVSGSIHAQYAHVDEYIYHSGDTDTAIRFLDDSLQFNAGSVAMVKLTEGSADVVTINPDSADVNFQVNGDTVANLLFVDAGTDNVGIGTSSPDQLLHVSGNTKTTNLYVASDIIHEGDTDTKIQFNTDIINFDTAGVERLRITAGGDVGIGTASPDSIVHVEQAKQTLNTTNLDNGTAVGLHLTYPDTTLTGGEGIALAMGMNGRGRSYIANIHQSSNKDASTLAFYTENGGTIAEKLRILPSGNVLIGTTTDSGYKLNVNGTAYASEFDLPSGGQLDWANGDARIKEGDVSNYSLSFQTYTGSALTTKMFISGSGNIGVGTTSPTQKLQVSSGDIMIDSGNAIHLTTTADHTKVQRSNNGLELFAGSSARVHVNDNGNVGIGTTSPSQKFHVVGNVRIDDGYTLGWGADTTKIAGNSSANTLAFKTSSADRLYINSSGNVGIGTTGPSDKLHVSGGNMFLDNGYGLRWGDNSVGIYGNASNETISMYTSSSERARITSGGNVLIGTTTDGGFKLDVNGTATFRDDVDMRTNAIDFKTSGSSTVPQFFGHRSGTDLDSRHWTNEAGWAYTTFDANSGNAPNSGSGLHNANGILSFNTHSGNYGHQIAMTTNTNKLYFRTRNNAAWQSWHEVTTDSKDFIPSADSTYDIGSSSVRFANGYFDTLYGDGSNLTGITATETDTLDSVTGRGATTTNSITVGGLTVDTSTLHVDATNNRVGVGTTSPTQSLDVNGTARAIKSKVDFTPTSDTIALDIRGTGTPNDYFTVSNATGGANDVFLPIFFYKAATYGYNGGTNRYPSGVYGGGFIAAVDDTSKPSSVGAGAAMHFNSRAYANNGALSSRYLFSWGSWISTYMAMTAGGNLLLGTTTDSGEKLQVNGDAKVSGDLEATGDFYQNGTQGWSGTINIPTNPAITITVQGGIITNVT